MARLLVEEVLLGKQDEPVAGTAVRVRATGLGGDTVWLRRRSSDRAALDFLYLSHHLPPAGLTWPVRHAAVFGANIGLLVADLAHRYPQARLLGVEPDHENATLARRNLAQFGERCVLKEAAVWYCDEALTFTWAPNAWGQIVTGESRPVESPAGARRIEAVDAGHLLAEFSGPAPVDYLLVNIESAWYDMLRNGHWTANVRCIKIEIEDHYAEAVPILEGLGYEAHIQRLSWGAFVTGIRPR